MRHLLRRSRGLLVLGVAFLAGTVQCRAVTDTLIFAQFGGGGGLVSEIVLMNPSRESPVEGRIDFLADSGGGLARASFGGRGREAGQRRRLQPASSRLRDALNSTEGEARVGCAVSTSAGPVAGVIRFRIPGIGVAGVGASEASPAFVVPVRQQGEIGTGIAVHNPGSQAVDLQLTLRDTSGTPVVSSAIEGFPARGHLAKYVSELYPKSGDFEGTLTVEASGGNVSGTAIELGSQAGQLTTLPVTRLTSTSGQAPGAVYFAQIGDGAGMCSSVLLVNPDRQKAVSGRLELLDDTGKPLGVGMEGEPVSNIPFTTSGPARGSPAGGWTISGSSTTLSMMWPEQPIRRRAFRVTSIRPGSTSPTT